MLDVQAQADGRRLAIDHVGVTDLRYPIIVLDQKNERQSTVATITMSVGLPHDFRGTHMSRFIEALEAHRGEFTMRTLPQILSDLRRRLQAETARVQVEFPYFLERSAPVTNAAALMDYGCTFTGEQGPDASDFVLGVRVPVMSVCPCSKAISDYGAHNQRGVISMQVRTRPATDFVWIEELVGIAEASGSAPVHPLLKREDERHVTMSAHDNPVFVEDMVRNAAAQLAAHDKVSWFAVEATNSESIHNHSAYARIERRKD